MNDWLPARLTAAAAAASAVATLVVYFAAPLFAWTVPACFTGIFTFISYDLSKTVRRRHHRAVLDGRPPRLSFPPRPEPGARGDDA